MKKFEGQALSWGLTDGVVESALHREPCNEIGLLTLEELERFAVVLEKATSEARALIIYVHPLERDLNNLHERVIKKAKAGVDL